VRVAQLLALHNDIFSAVTNAKPKIFMIPFLDRPQSDKTTEALAGDVDYSRTGHGDLLQGCCVKWRPGVAHPAVALS
jgi:hypothetical protein